MKNPRRRKHWHRSGHSFVFPLENLGRTRDDQGRRRDSGTVRDRLPGMAATWNVGGETDPVSLFTIVSGQSRLLALLQPADEAMCGQASHSRPAVARPVWKHFLAVKWQDRRNKRRD
jgi:hypothetical protein